MYRAPGRVAAVCSLCLGASGGPNAAGEVASAAGEEASAAGEVAREACDECEHELDAERWKGIKVGVRWSSLLGAAVVPVMLIEPARALALVAWVVAPIAWTLLWRGRPGARSEARAVGVAFGHAIGVALTALVVTGGMSFAGGGAPF
jgi:hypothetical protein